LSPKEEKDGRTVQHAPSTEEGIGPMQVYMKKILENTYSISECVINSRVNDGEWMGFPSPR